MALTQSERNKRYYAGHKKEESDRCKAYHIKVYPKIRVEKRRNYRNRMHHVSQEWLDAKLAEQNNLCAVCFQPFLKTPHIDHDHKCKHVRGSCDKCRRGLLCEDCNLGLGRFRDGQAVLENAIQYLKKYERINE